MQITPNRANQYRVPPQAKPSASVRFGGEGEEGLHVPATKDELVMGFKAQLKQIELVQKENETSRQKLANLISSLEGSTQAAQSQNQGTSKDTSKVESSTKTESSKPAEAPSNQQADQENAPAANVDTAKPKWMPRNERTRWSVAKDVTKQYFTGGKVLWDLGLGVAVGALFAIGSPVMVVTIPTAWAVYGGWRLIQLAWKMGHDPKGDKIDAMYKKW